MTEQILNMVIERTGITREQLFQPTRGKEPVAFARHLYLYLLTRFTNMTVGEIAKHISRHHSVISHSVEQVSIRCGMDEGIRDLVIEMETELDNVIV